MASNLTKSLSDGEYPHLSTETGRITDPADLGRRAAVAGWTIDELIERIRRTLGSLDYVPDAEIAEAIRTYVLHTPTTAHVRTGVNRFTREVLRSIALHQIVWGRSGHFNFEHMLADVMELMASGLSCDACSIFLYDPYQRTLMLRATFGLNPRAVGRVVIRVETGLTGLAARTRQPQFAEVASENPNWVPYPDIGESAFTSQLSVPIVLTETDQLVGVLNLQTLDQHRFSDDEIEFIQSASNDIAVAIQSARLFNQSDEELNKRVRELHMLQAITRGLASTLKPDELLPMIASYATELTSGSTAAVFRAAENELASPAVLYPTDAAHELLEPMRLLAADVFATRIAAGVQPISSQPSILYGVPLLTRHTLLGSLVVQVDRRTSVSEDQLNLLQAYADSAALALENAELYDETRRGYATSYALLQEMHHRVRNNLQIVAALLSMQAREGADRGWDQPLNEAVARVQSIASIHDLLSGDEDVTSATLNAVARNVVDQASINVVQPSLHVEFVVEANDIGVTSRQAMILALVINECITNSVVHGFHGRNQGTIWVTAEQDDRWIEMRIEDDGVGLNPESSTTQVSGLGTRIIRALVESDLNGSFKLEPREPEGALTTVRFKAQTSSD